MSIGHPDPAGSNPEDARRSEPEASPRGSATPLEDHEQEPGGSHSWPTDLVFALFKLAAAGLLIYLTYYFSTTFAHRTPPLPPLSPEQQAFAKKADDLRTQGKALIGSYGWVDPATKSRVRIPVERAMELIVAEANRPPASPAATAPATAPAATGTAAALNGAAPAGPPAAPAVTSPAVAAAPMGAALAPAPAGMSAQTMYRMVCLACHDTDGRGKIVRGAGMPTIPDLTDAKWQASRTDAELQHSILEGKESLINGIKLPLMLPMKDKLALGHTDVKDMVAFMRAFKGGKQVVSIMPGAAPAPIPGLVADASPPAAAVPAPAPAPAIVSPAPAPTSAGPVATTTKPAAAPASAESRPSAPPPGTSPERSVASTATAAPAAGTSTAPASLSPALPARNVNTAARAAKLNAAGGIFQTLCIACHGLDGRGTAVRVAMPTLPNFTLRDWQTSRSNSQLATSIMEGKGTGMPPWNTKLSADNASDLVLYVRNFGPPDLLAAEQEPASGPSMAEFDGKMQSLRQKFDDLEKQLQALSSAPRNP
jgi:mono/diheme cytochrome c family protein